MRQYRIFCNSGFGYREVTPKSSPELWDREHIHNAIAHMRENPEVDGMSVRDGLDQYNIVQFDQPAEAPNAWRME